MELHSGHVTLSKKEFLYVEAFFLGCYTWVKHAEQKLYEDSERHCLLYIREFVSPSRAMSRDTEAVGWSLFEDESAIPAAAKETWQLKDACQILLDRIDQNCPFLLPG